MNADLALTSVLNFALILLALTHAVAELVIDLDSMEGPVMVITHFFNGAKTRYTLLFE